ncbi:hypothetical protein H257_10293 [Aphanomyces astaci]|uniref:Uncharacterized protein n=1 Tax=Aphanomyces astaci TaxID=112090 RepID=W4G6W9_APHAT|nr:hypothetical protein H257_10293 [Aphanomyces astaci]ETV75452.1 hypothetical protein H257_10293 [Aphanomyces astaci]|eukprot:XP_009835086.1 hypothetical protein H257_10293 [Aphanomyces astaci]
MRLLLRSPTETDNMWACLAHEMFDAALEPCNRPGRFDFLHFRPNPSSSAARIAKVSPLWNDYLQLFHRVVAVATHLQADVWNRAQYRVLPVGYCFYHMQLVPPMLVVLWTITAGVMRPLWIYLNKVKYEGTAHTSVPAMLELVFL